MASKKRGTKNRGALAFDDDPPGGPVDHPPVIITDGSAAIEFAEGSYQKQEGKNLHVAIERLHLVDIVSDRPHTPGRRNFTCFTLKAGDQCEIEVSCEGGGGFNNFIFRGNFASTPPPEIEFDRGEYKINTIDFPARNPLTGGRRFGSKARRVVRLQIFKVVGGKRVEPAEHDCPLVSTPGNGWTINDDHA